MRTTGLLFLSFGYKIFQCLGFQFCDENQFYDIFLPTRAPNISLPLPFAHIFVGTQVSIKEQKPQPSDVTTTL